jgi:outer membrane immunogenic protein
MMFDHVGTPKMKKIALAAAAASILLTGAASAADLRRPIAKAPPPMVAPIYSWTGFYIGGFVGGAWADRDAVTTDPCNNAVGLQACLARGFGTFNGVAPTPHSLESSFIGGGTVGVNYQVNNFVFGLEGEVGYLRLRGSVLQNPPPVGLGDTFAQTTIGDWYAFYGGRVGVAFDRTLLYVKGGGTTVNVNTGVVDTVGVTLDTRSDTHIHGWAAGGGVEYAFNPNWTIKGEYLYLGIRKDVITTGTTSTGVFETVLTSVPGVHTAKIGINYKFGWGGPVVAKY